VGVSCSADRNILARIDRTGVWLEELEHDPARFIPEKYRTGKHRHGTPVDLNRPMKEILADEASKGGVLDRAFIDAETTGFDELRASLDAVTFE
jgi:hypothetical protein